MMTNEIKLKIADILRETVPCNFLLNYINSTRTQCNQTYLRGLKAHIRDTLFEFASKEFFKYVDKKGNDLCLKHPDLSGEIKLECKGSIKGYLFTEAKKRRGVDKNQNRKIIDPFVPSVDIYNSNAKLQTKKIPTGYSDVIILLEPCCVSLLFVEDLNKFLHSKPGKLVAKNVPINLFYPLMTCFDADYKYLDIEFNMQEKVDNSNRDIIKSFSDLYNEKARLYNTDNLEERKKMNNIEMTYELISKYNSSAEGLNHKTLSELFLESYGLQKNEKQIHGYCNVLVKKGKLLKTKKKTEIGQENLYRICQINSSEDEINKSFAENTANIGVITSLEKTMTITLQNGNTVKIENVMSSELSSVCKMLIPVITAQT